MLGSVSKSSAVQINSERTRAILPHLILLLLYSGKHTKNSTSIKKKKLSQTKPNQNSLSVDAPFGQQKAK